MMRRFCLWMCATNGMSQGRCSLISRDLYIGLFPVSLVARVSSWQFCANRASGRHRKIPRSTSCRRHCISWNCRGWGMTVLRRLTSTIPQPLPICDARQFVCPTMPPVAWLLSHIGVCPWARRKTSVIVPTTSIPRSGE